MLVRLDATLWQVATQRLTPLVQVTHLGCVFCRFIVRQLMQLAIWYRNVKAVTNVANVFVRELFGLVHRVFALTGLAHAVAFNGFNQQHSGLVFGAVGRMKSRVHLLRLVPATAQFKHFFVGHVLYQLSGFRVLAKEVFTNKSTVVGLHGLVVAVQGFHHQLAQPAALVARKQSVPTRTP